MWFSLHVIFGKVNEIWIGPLRLILPNPATLDPLALAIAAAAMLAMLHFRVGIFATIVAAGASGILFRLF